MTAGDLPAATRAWRLAFGTYLKAPDPERFRPDLRTIETRFATDPDACFVAEREGAILGSVIGMSWGSQFVLGPLTVDPAHWGGGVARRLTARILEEAARRKAGLVALFTFPQSATHLRLYQSFGFAPMWLTPIVARPVERGGAVSDCRLFGVLAEPERAAMLAACRGLTEMLLPGLDLGREILAVERQRLGATLLIESADGLAGFAVCHIGAGEAEAGICYVKFAAVRPGAGGDFERLLDAVESVAAARGAARVTFGVNTARRDAWRRIEARGYRAGLVGVAMHRPDVLGTLRPELYLIDDCR